MGRVFETLSAAVGSGADAGAAAAAQRVRIAPGDTGLSARLSTGDLALDSVTFFASQVSRLLGLPSITVEPRRVGVNFSSYNYLSINEEPAAAWAPLSGFFATADGWVRTHANYPHHRARLCRAFGLPEMASREQLAAALQRLEAKHAEELAFAAGALCVRVREPEEFAELIAPAPLLEWQADAGGTGLRQAQRSAAPRVLDFSRVIAGPTATRALALIGADVLRIDPPEPAEIEMQHIDTGAGKRSAVLDLAQNAELLHELLAGADAVVLGYRSGSLDRFGLSEQSLRERYPHLVIASLSAYPQGSAWAERRGFDSLVQAASGIALIEGDTIKPGVLRAQALDHATGYMLAGGICAALAEGRPATVRASLAATAQALIGLGPSNAADAPLPTDAAALDSELETVPSAAGSLRRARVIVDVAGHPQGPVVPLGSSEPAWL